MSSGTNDEHRIQTTLGKRKEEKESLAMRLKRSTLKRLQCVEIPTFSLRLPSNIFGQHGDNILTTKSTSGVTSPAAPPSPTPSSTESARGKENSDLIMDPSSVSTYSSENVFIFMHENESCYCIGLKKTQVMESGNWVFIGYVLVGVLAGSIEINGATISADVQYPIQLQVAHNICQVIPFFPVFSAKPSSLCTVKSIPYEKVHTTTPSTTLESSFNDMDKLLEPIKSNLGELETILVVKNLDWCGVDRLVTRANFFDLGTLDGYIINDGPFYEDIDAFHPIINETPGIKALEQPKSWSVSVDLLLQYEKDHLLPSMSLVYGSQTVGKSSFTQYMINRLLKTHRRVAYLDTNVGQPEFTPPGLMSLHIIETPLLGPNFTRPHYKPKDSFFLGPTFTSTTSSYYQQCFDQLLETYKQTSNEWLKIAKEGRYFSDYHLLPLIINTKDSNQLAHLFNTVHPTQVYTFTPPPNDIINDMMMSSRLTVLQPISLPSNDQIYPPQLHQDLMLKSYLYHDQNTFGQVGTPWWQVPEWQLDGTLVGLVGSMERNQGSNIEVDDDDNDELVMIEKDEFKNQQQSSPSPSLLSSSLPPPITSRPDPATTTCYGLAVQRDDNLLITPLSYNRVKRTIGLVGPLI